MSFLKSISVYLAAGFLTIDSLSAYDNREKRISELEKQMLEVGSYHPGGVFGARFASASPLNSDWQVAADVLLWQAKVGGTEYAYSVSSITESGASFPLNGTISEISFNWDWGFRLEVGKQNIYEECDLILSYTQFLTSGRNGYRKDLPSGFLGLTGFLDPALVAKSHYRLRYQNLDLEFGKAYFVSKQLLFRTYIGLKSCWIKQKQNSHYEFNVNFGDAVSFVSSLKDTCNFWGLGPRIGVLSRWYLGKEVSLINKLSGALLYGYYKVEDNYNTEESKTIDNEIERSFGNVDIKGVSHHFCPFTEIAVGLSWNRAYIQDKLILTVSLSYETLYFSRQKETLSGEGLMRTGSTPILISSSQIRFAKQVEDIGFRGVSLSIEVDF